MITRTPDRIWTEVPAVDCHPGYHRTSKGGNYRSTITEVKRGSSRWDYVRIYFTEPDGENYFHDFSPRTPIPVSFIPTHPVTATPDAEKPAEKPKMTVEAIRKALQNPNDWLFQQRAILALYKFQTAAEQNVGLAIHHNGVGFNQPDSGLLSSFARQLKRGKVRLSDRQLYHARKRLPKYAKQLHKIAYG